MSMKVGNPKAAKKRCDTLFSKIVRARDRHCQNCGREDQLQCAHIFTRARSFTRCDFENAVALCARCHIYFTNNPTEWGIWVVEYMGMRRYEELRDRSQVRSLKFDWEAKALELKEIWKTFQ